MLIIVDLSNQDKWNSIVKSFQNYDVYYLAEYVKGFKLVGDGEPLLFYYYTDKLRAINVVMVRDISKCEYFHNILQENKFFDIATPYGYGGFLLEGEYSSDLDNEYVSWCKDNSIVSEFVRFNPLTRNEKAVIDMYQEIEIGSTVTMDLADEKTIWDNLHSKNRNVIRKAQKNGVEIKSGNDFEIWSEFERLYKETMIKDKANNYYFFNQDFYDSLRNDLLDYSKVVYAEYNGKIISASVILFANKKVHYHLSGSDCEYRNLSPSNLLLYDVAVEACKKGYKYMHLGGGVGGNKDNLYQFKSVFNRNSDSVFYVGKKIFDMEKYNYLCKLRKIDDINGKSFFPQYRV